MFFKVYKVLLFMSLNQGPLYLIPVWVSNRNPSKVWDEIFYPSPNFNGCAIEVWKWISSYIPHFEMDIITYPCYDLSQSVDPENTHKFTQPIRKYAFREIEMKI